MRYFLGVDVGATKTHALITAETGQALGFGQAGPGNHETVGYEGLRLALQTVTHQALSMAGLSKAQLAGAGFGVAGYDWPPEREPTLEAIGTLGLTGPVEAVNDALIGLLAGAEEGWGLAIVSGTSCNCWGWDRDRRRQGQVTGGSLMMGEAAGAGELVHQAIQRVAHEWTKRGLATQLTPAFIQYTGARDLPDLLQGLTDGYLKLNHQAAPLVFEVAAAGDPVAIEVIHWAGCELGELAKAVIRQLHFEALAFEVVLVGSLFKGGSLLVEPMQETIRSLAPHARFIRLETPPVVGAALLGMEQVGVKPGEVRAILKHSAGRLWEQVK